MRLIFVLLITCVSLFAQGTNLGQNKIPVDGYGKPLAVIGGYTGSAFYALGMSGAIFTRFDATNLWTTSAITPTGTLIPEAYRSAGVYVTNNSGSTMAVWFAMVDNPSSAATPDTFYVLTGTETFFPVRADSVYILQSTNKPQVQIQTGTVDQ